jgi:hypothetical protein
VNLVPHTNFLLGHRYTGGSPLFYPVSLLIKTPLGALVLWAMAVVRMLRSSRRVELSTFVLAIPVVLLLFAMTSNVNLGVRHVLVVPMGLAVAAGILVQGGGRRLAAGAVALVVLAATSTVAAYPSHLAYVNEAFGGSARAYKLMSDSNVDWGQDLRRLTAYANREHLSGNMSVVYFGSAPYDLYGLRARDVTFADPASIHGTVAISVTALNSFYGDRFAFIAHGRHPIHQIGHSILIFRLP